MPVTLRRGARTSNIAAPPAPTGIDLIVTNIAWTGTPVSGDQVIFRATVQNIGDTATPGGTILDVAFLVDDETVSWSDTDTTSLAAGATRVLIANSGPVGNAYWPATIGTHTVLADVNSIDRITESNGTNNTLSTSITIAAGGGAPDLPANAAVGTPCAHEIGWGDGTWVYLSQATLSTWYSRGFHGYRFGTVSLYGHDQWDTDFKPSSSAGNGAVYAWQQQLEPSGANHAAQASAVGYDMYLGWTLRHAGVSQNVPPYGNWFDDPTWADACVQLARWQAAADYMGFGGSMSLDSEFSGNAWLADGYQGDTHTAAQNRAQARLRGAQMGAAIWGTNPATRLLWYELLIPGGWNNKVQQVVNGSTFPENNLCVVDFLQGLFDGMIAANATGEIVLCDFTMFRPADNFVSGAVQRAVYQLNSMGSRAWLSNYFDQAVWNYAAYHFKIVGFTWKGKDGTGFYDTTLPSDATWSTMLMEARNHSEGSRRVEYNGPQEGWPGGGGNIYAGATAIAGSQAAASTTPLSTSVPGLTGTSGSGNPTVVKSGTQVTVAGRATHLDGIYGVSVHRGSTWNSANQLASRSGVCKMTFVENGGNYNSNYDASYQTLAFTSTDGVWAAETYAVLVCTSIHDDVRYLTVTIT